MSTSTDSTPNKRLSLSDVNSSRSHLDDDLYLFSFQLKHKFIEVLSPIGVRQAINVLQFTLCDESRVSLHLNPSHLVDRVDDKDRDPWVFPSIQLLLVSNSCIQHDIFAIVAGQTSVL